VNPAKHLAVPYVVTMEAVPGPGGRWVCRAAHPELPGTDTPNPFVLPGQSMHDELELLVGSGLTPMQAIVAGTSRAAELAGLADRIGAVKPGYCADLLVVRGDPVSSITATRSVALVIKSGRIVSAENPSLPPAGR
jgi:adenine deaminase